MHTLYGNPISPFYRMCVVAAMELGLDKTTAFKDGDYNDLNSELYKVSPVGLIPALKAADGRCFTSSKTIVRFMDSQSHERALFPSSQDGKFRVIENEALAHVVMDAGVDRMRNRRMPDQEPSQYIDDKLKARVDRVLDHMENNPGWLSDKFFIDDIAWVSALEYLDYRFADDAWREGRPSLMAWYNMQADRPSVAQTRTAYQ